ncbi:HAMP domain-containing histidine kinase [Chitinibacter fontanus]|uniref:histidine kinase n=1 Tax=Chitinibacter fontanus TaxID=1737446 RepID=A0A7D5V8Y2_9NEIS|nr:HAMP domain-containing sensor histidine kinase [Chitinibacter fontanus]QLI81071.1 HAMP domain-containing histidine kinase [Chitinibacter fontanus]
MTQNSRSISEALWRSLAFFNVFRLLTIIGLMVGIFTLTRSPLADSKELVVVAGILGSYTLFALLFTWGIAKRWPRFDLQLSLQVMVDVLMIVSLMHLGGGIKSGLGILLLPYLAAAGLIARGRMSLFHASMASIALLLQLSWSYVQGDAAEISPMSTALLSIASFAVAWLAFRLSRYAEENRVLAEQRSIDLANLAQVNERILQDVSDGVFVVDEQDLIRQYNEQAVRVTGLRPEIGSALAADIPELAAPLARWRAQHGVATELVQTADGRNTLRARFVPLSTEGNGNVLIYLEDMARLRREAQQLKLAALGRLTANLAHEIRNPLGAISHAAELLQEDAIDSPYLQKLTRIITDNSQRLERMVKDVLELNRRDRVKRQDIKLAEWLVTFNEQFVLQEKTKVPMSIECDPQVLIRFDSGHLQQVLWNLARNGWRYCSQQAGSLQLLVTRQHDFWVLDVLNDGPPVPADAQSQLFEPFFTTESKGTGLGLYIAREICAANGALLEYISPPSGGACFRIVFGYTDGQKI